MEEKEWGQLNYFSNVGNAGLQYTKHDYRITNTSLLKNLFAVEMKTDNDTRMRLMSNFRSVYKKV
jgi:hypothetical protein